MGPGIVFALCAAVFMGTATVLQAMGARRAVAATPGAAGSGARTLVAALRRWPFVAGVALDMAGFAAELVALRSVPLFVVEAALASSLAVTAVAAALLLGVRLRRQEWAAVAAVCLGLVVLAVSAGRDGHGEGTERLRLAVLVVALALAVAGRVTERAAPRNRAAVLGAVAGLSFGVVAVAVRMLVGFTPRELLTDPAAYAVAVAGVTGFVFLVDALQSGSVTAATAAMVITESLWPAVFGVVWLGDTTRHDRAPLAVLGFALSITGALALTRFGEAEQTAPPT
ncbi:DMT family transporter [Streptomyces sp. NPDC046977]|uniref:DMT family transporter n=1 Tax=Streptomyces sp. NPDC046977 TaxID=3154703 RepID=UPI00340CEC21